MEGTIEQATRQLVAIADSAKATFDSYEPSAAAYATYLEDLREILVGEFIRCSGQARSRNQAHCLAPIFELAEASYLIEQVYLVGNKGGDYRYLFIRAEDGTTHEVFWAELKFPEAESAQPPPAEM